MDSIKPVLNDAVTSLVSAKEQLNNIEGVSEEEKKQAAKDFESIFIHKLLEEMKKTIGDWGLEKDDTSRQTQGIFWLYLARDIANNGGFGMWKDIYQFWADSQVKKQVTQSSSQNKNSLKAYETYGS